MPDVARLRPLPGPLAPLKADVHTVVDGAGLWLFKAAPGVLVLQADKRIAGGHAASITSFADKMLARDGRLHVFYDLQSAPAYDSDARSAMTTWSLQHRGKNLSHHIFTTSKLVSMGIATASLLLEPAGIRVSSFGDRAAFDAELLKSTVA